MKNFFLARSRFILLFSVVFLSITITESYAFETYGGAGAAHPWLSVIQIGKHIGLPIHQDITKEGLSFLNTNTKTLLADQHLYMEANQTSIYHFDNCAFSGTVNNINQRYRMAVSKLNPSSPDVNGAAEEFGRLLHQAQDFYSHSNWIEMSRADLIDDTYSYWNDIKPFSYTSNKNPVFSLEVPADGNTKSKFYSRNYNEKVIHVKENNTSYPTIGLISGTYGNPSENKCPSDASIPHGSSIGPHFSLKDAEQLNDPNELNKDHPKRTGHAKAMELATEQTTHEFCRLVELTRAAWNDDGVKLIYDNWVENTNNPVLSNCPLHKTQTGTSNGTGTSIGKTSSIFLPGWFKNNAKWFYDGLITEQDLVLAIENLIEQNVITIKQSTQPIGQSGDKIPSYIKEVFGFWAEGKVSDQEIADSLQYMVDHGIIKSKKISQMQNQNEIEITDPEMLKDIYLASFWQNYGSYILLEIKNYEQDTLDDLSDEAWSEYSKNKDVDHMQLAQDVDGAKNTAKSQTSIALDIIKTTKQSEETIREDAIKAGISQKDLDDKVQAVDEKKVSFGKVDSSKLSQAYKEGVNAFSIADRILDDISNRYDIDISAEGPLVKDRFWFFPNETDQAKMMLNSGPLVKPEYFSNSSNQDGKIVSVLIIDNKYYPLVQFHKSSIDVGCPKLHYHTPYLHVLSTDGTTIIDNDKPHCGFGPVDSVSVTEVFMTQDQIDGFVVATGLNP